MKALLPRGKPAFLPTLNVPAHKRPGTKLPYNRNLRRDTTSLRGATLADTMSARLITSLRFSAQTTSSPVSETTSDWELTSV
jgi:hypothetical protein